jgi:Tfp pilus assembly protein PilF
MRLPWGVTGFPSFLYLYGAMKQILILLAALGLMAVAQAQDAAQMHETARTFMRQGDFPNAILVLNRAIQKDPQNLAIAKDLAFSYSYQNDNAKALEVVKPLLDREDADDQCFQIAGNIYKGLDNPKDCEKMYRKGLKKFPNSGPLYNELGELLWAQKDFSAIKQWEKGIETDPNYSLNYLNACKYYYFTTDKVWSLLYGEIFVNMEPMGSRTPEVKNILLEGYKKLFAEADITKAAKKNTFAAAFLQTIGKQSAVIGYGINPESLTMLRARFILDWYAGYADQYPFKLFELQRQLLQEGMFDAYNQWIFGAAQNLPAYQNWTSAHANEAGQFNRFQKSRLFKIPTGQYHQ